MEQDIPTMDELLHWRYALFYYAFWKAHIWLRQYYSYDVGNPHLRLAWFAIPSHHLRNTEIEFIIKHHPLYRFLQGCSVPETTWRCAGSRIASPIVVISKRLSLLPGSIACMDFIGGIPTFNTTQLVEAFTDPLLAPGFNRSTICIEQILRLAKDGLSFVLSISVFLSEIAIRWIHQLLTSFLVEDWISLNSALFAPIACYIYFRTDTTIDYLCDSFFYMFLLKPWLTPLRAHPTVLYGALHPTELYEEEELQLRRIQRWVEAVIAVIFTILTLMFMGDKQGGLLATSVAAAMVMALIPIALLNRLLRWWHVLAVDGKIPEWAAPKIRLTFRHVWVDEHGTEWAMY